MREKQPYVTLSITLSADHSAGFILTAFSPPQSPTPSAYRLIATQPPGTAAGVSGRADSEALSRDDSSVYLHDGGGHSPKARSQNRYVHMIVIVYGAQIGRQIDCCQRAFVLPCL